MSEIMCTLKMSNIAHAFYQDRQSMNSRYMGCARSQQGTRLPGRLPRALISSCSSPMAGSWFAMLPASCLRAYYFSHTTTGMVLIRRDLSLCLPPSN